MTHRSTPRHTPPLASFCGSLLKEDVLLNALTQTSMMSEDGVQRIKNDIVMFKKNLEKLLSTLSSEPRAELKRIVELATRYYEDARFYLERGDVLTAFGCINYAHGLLDAVRIELGLWDVEDEE